MDLTQARTEFASALRQVVSERGIDPEAVIDAVKHAILAAYKKELNLELVENVTVEVDPDSGELGVFEDGKDVTPPGFGRIASQTAKQVILQKIREAEKAALITEYREKVGSVQSGMIQRYDGEQMLVDMGRAEAVFPRSEQVFRERYRLNQRLTFYIKEIAESERGEQIVVSRADPNLVKEVFRREVPEVSSGAVEIKAISREPGFRTKVAVYSSQSGVDPVGSCVGQKGVRVQAVITEIGEERVDVIAFSDDTEKFIASSLAPAKGVLVDLDKEQRVATVTCPADQLSLAIGREGQNVRLAAKLTGWKIDIKAPKDAEIPEEIQATYEDFAKVGLEDKKDIETDEAKAEVVVDQVKE